MQYLYNIFNILVAIPVLALVSCTAHDGIIPKNDMTRIIGEMYLADHYIELRPELRGQTDSLILYEGVLQRNGYTIDEYKKSVMYYLQQGDALKKIYVNARKQIIKRRDELNKSVHQGKKKSVYWWIADTLSKKSINSLWKEPYLRNIKWIANLKTKQIWQFTDSVTFDVPQNILWWKNTILSNSTKSPADSLYPILQRDYLIWREKNQQKESLPEFSEGKRRAKIDMKKYNKQKEVELKMAEEAKRMRAEMKQLRNSGK